MDNSTLIKRAQDGEAKLKQASIALKNHFVGLDNIIDKIIDNIRAWYCFPELISRPVIINLFGPTGTGKTDLVRRLVKQLNFSDRYTEVELANNASKSWHKSIAGVLRESNRIESGKPAVILLDEIQNFRTLDEEGNEISDYELKDVWTLLSDGKLPFKVEIEALLGMLWDYNKRETQNKNPPKPCQPFKKRMALFDKMSKPKSHRSIKGNKRRRKIEFEVTGVDDSSEEQNASFYHLSYFKSVLRLEEPIEEIALWSDQKKKETILKRLTDKSIYEEEDFTKCLIFISGNLDEAYGFTRNAKEVDIDADILYEMSKKISILDIKEALGKRFRPEQISRMGNIQMIYPSLSRIAFETIIQRKMDLIIQRVFDKTNIRLTVDPSINKLVYDNGVFPTQGTRPVFSTLSEIVESSLPDFLMEAMINGVEDLEMTYENNAIVGKVKGQALRKPFVGNLDELREKKQKNKNRKALAAVHEAAHAIIHAILFGVAPNQIVASPVSEDMEGFVYSQDVCLSKDMIKKRIMVLLAGQEAEKIVFGEDNQTSGVSDDLRKATGFAASMVRRWGMSNWASQINDLNKNDLSNNDIDSTNNIVESLVRDGRIAVRDLLLDNKPLLTDVIDKLMDNDKVTPEEFKDICEKKNLKVEVSSLSEDVVYWEYYDRFLEWRK